VRVCGAVRNARCIYQIGSKRLSSADAVLPATGFSIGLRAQFYDCHNTTDCSIHTDDDNNNDDDDDDDDIAQCCPQQSQYQNTMSASLIMSILLFTGAVSRSDLG